MPSAEIVKKAVDAISKRGVNYIYFFDNLQSPDWIDPLLREGMFQHAPEPERKGDLIAMPFWPESRYLARMAGKSRGAAELVLRIALDIHTENMWVHRDFAQAALAMRPDLAARWTTKESQWIESQASLPILLPEEYGLLISHLAGGQEADAALQLARTLLQPLPDPEAEEKANESRLIPRSPEPRMRLEPWHYEDILEKHMPDLVECAGMRGLEMLCDLLGRALTLSQHPRETDAPREDYSYIWRLAVEDDSNHHYDELKNPLISAIRDAGEQLVAAGTLSMAKLVGQLESYGWPIFHRIALHLLRVCPHDERELVVERVTDRSCFKSVTMRHEYVLLFKDSFGQLSKAQQSAILEWIEEGPWYLTGDDPPGAADRWRRDWLSIINEHLPARWKQRHEELVAELGPAEHLEFPDSLTTTWFGPTSPKASSDLASMSVEEVVDYLRNWKPSGKVMDHSPEGLGRDVEAAVAMQPARFGEAALQFRAVSEPTYINALFRGLGDALKENKTFPWQPVVELADSVVAQPREIPGRVDDSHHDRDPHWGWTRQSIASLLEDGFVAKKGGVPFRLRSAVWRLLEVLTEDPDPTPEHEVQYGGTNQEPATMSINTVRGVAMHAVVRYAFWVRQRLEKRKRAKELLARGFEEMQEVREMLDRHLDPQHDPSLTIRSVYGWWFPQLVLLDPRWAKANVHRVFPASEEHSDLRDAAWETYMAFCQQLYGSVYDILQGDYDRAVERVGAPASDRRRRANPDEQLAKHLMTLYWRGRIGLQKLERFFERASPELRGYALSYVGQSLRNMEGQAAARKLGRLRELWTWRLAEAGGLPAPDPRAELSSFGWWLLSGHFSKSWCLVQLREVLRLANWAEPDDEVLKYLADLAPQKPRIAVECLARMTDGEQQGWRIGHSWVPSIRRIITIARQSPDAETRQAAEDLVNRLGARGFLQYRDLLER